MVSWCMATKSRAAVLVLLMFQAVPTAAQAEEVDAPDPLRVGLSGVVMAGDDHNPGGPGMSLGGSPTVDLQVGRHFFLGLGPQASVKFQTSEANSSRVVVLDLLFRLGWVLPVGERVQLYWYLAPGYSALFRRTETHWMPSVGAYFGGALHLANRMFATLQVGYQHGWILDLGDSVRFHQRPGMAIGLLMQI
jgi:uncharacterized membrane protein